MSAKQQKSSQNFIAPHVFFAQGRWKPERPSYFRLQIFFFYSTQEKSNVPFFWGHFAKIASFFPQIRLNVIICLTFLGESASIPTQFVSGRFVPAGGSLAQTNAVSVHLWRSLGFQQVGVIPEAHQAAARRHADRSPADCQGVCHLTAVLRSGAFLLFFFGKICCLFAFVCFFSLEPFHFCFEMTSI